MMDNITANILTNSNIPLINNGIGKLKIVDIIQDKWNNPKLGIINLIIY